MDYNENVSPVIRFLTVRLMFAIVAVQDLEHQKMNGKTVFLNEDLDVDIKIEQRESCVNPAKPEHVCRLL